MADLKTDGGTRLYRTDITLDADKVVGQLVTVGDMVGVCETGGLATDVVALTLSGKWQEATATATFAVGDGAYTTLDGVVALPKSWVASTAYVANEIIDVTTSATLCLVVTTGGTSHATVEPDLAASSIGDVITDNTATYKVTKKVLAGTVVGASATTVDFELGR